MEKIIPRWEWRTFGESFGEAEDKIKASGAPFTRESAEIYIISKRSNDNTKIRDELMDIKTLRNINDNKLEQWYPIMKSGFPLPKGEYEKVCASWAVAAEDVGGEVAYDDFLQRIVGGNDDLKAVPVTKLRHGFKIDDATLELADLTIADEKIRTVCIEHADEELVWRLVKELGLSGFDNVNYLTAIKRTVGWGDGGAQ